MSADALAPPALTLPPDLPTPSLATGSVQFVGTATVILRHAGFTILTDPNFVRRGARVAMGYGLTAERLTDPAIALEQVPRIDFAVLSHWHGDHFDAEVQARLNRELPILTTPSAARTLSALGFNALHPLATWESIVIAKGGVRARITALPARHGPPVIAHALPDAMGTLLAFDTVRERGARIYVSGDTLFFPGLREIAARFPQLDVALLHLGGERLRGVPATMDAEQGIEALRLFDAAITIPIHYNDYSTFRSPLEDFLRAAKREGLSDKVRCLRHGQSQAFAVRRARGP